MLAAAAALAFDMTSVLTLMYPGRERVEITGTDGATYVYACKPGPTGETPEERAGKAQAAFEENAVKFGERFAREMMEDIEAGVPSLETGLSMSRDINSWAGSITAHLETTYGCALLS